MAIKTKDTFVDTDGVNIESHTPTGTGATGAWSRIGGAVGTANILANKVRLAGTTQTLYAGTDNAATDHYVEVTAAGTFSGQYFPLVVRATDASNWIGFRIQAVYELYTCVGGTFTLIASGASGTWSVGDVFRLECTGTSIVAKRNGTTIVSATSSAHASATLSGFVARSSTSSALISTYESGDLVVLPNPPTGVTVSSVTANSATVSWTDASSDETGFKVQTSPSPYSVWTTVSGSPTAANAVSIGLTGLTDGTAYKARVASTNASGDSAWVESGVFTTIALTKVRPSATTTAGAWSASGAATLHAAINETPASDAEFITTSGATVGKFKIASASNPGTTSGHTFSFRAKGDGASALKVDLVQGDPSETIIKTTTVTPGTSFALYTVNLSSGEAATITDYSQLYFKIAAL